MMKTQCSSTHLCHYLCNLVNAKWNENIHGYMIRKSRVWGEAKRREIARREMTTSNWNLVGSSGRGLEKKVVQNELIQQRAQKQSAGGTGQAC